MYSDICGKAYITSVISEIFANSNISKSEVTFDILSSFKIINNAIDILKKEPSVLIIDTPESIIIVGDIHGDINSLINIFNTNGIPSTTKYIFLGDYVDRGKNSCEVIILLYAFKVLFPENIYLIRGNHEFRDMNDHYGFKKECYEKVKTNINGKTLYGGKKFYEKVTDSFQYLPICAILNGKTFCVHGGITALIEDRNELLNIEKVGVKFSYNDSIQAELLWNDPDPEIDTYKKGLRGIGCLFGSEALNDFLENMEFKNAIRAHQNEMDGYNYVFGKDGGIITIFSSVDYCGTLNDGAVAIVTNDGTIIPSKIEMNEQNNIPENIIENNLTFMNDVLYNPDLNIDLIPCFA